MAAPSSALGPFHSATQHWFLHHVGQPSPIQIAGWPAIGRGGHVLMAAPTGSGKTLAALLHALDGLMVSALNGALPDQVRVVYVSPLKALSADVHHNLEGPLAGLAQALEALHLGPAKVRVACRTGDTPQAERARILKKPPHVLVTTPESLYLLLGCASGQKLLRHVRTLIVDEVHALANNRRGSHLSLSVEHLADIVEGPLQRIGLSATQKPMVEVARFLVGAGNIDVDGNPHCTLVDVTGPTERDVALCLPDSPLSAIMSHEVWQQVYAQLAALIEGHNTTLVFVNTRRMAERIAFVLAERLGEDTVVAHHGSLAASVRKTAEDRLKTGQLRAIVATGSLELGIDMGDIDLVCQVGSLRAIGTFIQRIGRANHRQGGVPKGRLFPLTRDELVECTALIRAMREGDLDTLHIPKQPLDILAQQLVARVSARGDETTDMATLRAWVRRAYPYCNLTDAQFDSVLTMVADGYATRRGRRGTLVHVDRVHGEVRPRKGAQLAALTCGGAIADPGDYKVVLVPQELVVGQLTEDFAVDSHIGDVFVLGTMHWRIVGIKTGAVLVEDAHDCPPSMPFWAGEAPSRSPELSAQVSILRRLVAGRIDDAEGLIDELSQDPALPRAAMVQMVTYLHATQHALGVMPHDGLLVAERFFDSAGGMQMVLHCPLGSRLNRAFGLALRKRFCKSFNFELQAAATEDTIVLSLGEVHSFALGDVFAYLNAKTVRHVLIQALLDAPMFQTRWRWNAGRSLAVLRMWGGQKVAPQILRMQAEDLVAAVFPDQIACLENIQGERQVPDHPLVQQTIDDCLHEAMDIVALEDLLRRLASGALQWVAVDTPEPSPACHEILVAKPYTFLDDGDAEERRTHAVFVRRDLRRADEPGAAGQISDSAMTRVCQEAWPTARTADEVHDALMTMVFGLEPAILARTPTWAAHLTALVDGGRAVEITLPHGGRAWICTEQLNVWAALAPRGVALPPVLQAGARRVVDELPVLQEEMAYQKVVAGLMQVWGPVTAEELAQQTGFEVAHIDAALLGLERQGFVMRGAFRTLALRADIKPEWCERRLLARLHRYTVQSRRKEVRPVSPEVYQHFLCHWQSLAGDDRAQGMEGLRRVLGQLAGLELPAKAWEADILPARVLGFDRADLDQLCMTGEMGWGRISQPTSGTQPRRPLSTSPMAVMARRDAWAFSKPQSERSEPLAPEGDAAQRVLTVLASKGALFTLEIARLTALSPLQVAEGLTELAALGLVASDSFAGLRALLDVQRQAAAPRRRLLSRHAPAGAQAIDRAGRWSLSAASEPLFAANQGSPTAHVQEACKTRIQAFLGRWGVICHALLRRENNLGSWPQAMRLLRQMELRGEVMGGYFIAGISGEQFADVRALRLLARLRDLPQPKALLVTSAADPINLTGILGEGPRVPRLRKHRLIFRDGVPIAYWGKDSLQRLRPDPATDGALLACLADSQTALAQTARPKIGRATSPF